MKDFVRVMKALSDPNWVMMVKMLQHKTAGKSPYGASLLGSLRHWLDDDKEVEDLGRRLPLIRREDLCRKGAWFFCLFYITIWESINFY
jgi:hypothetical protein